MLYSASHITYWKACWRKLWLFQSGIILEQESEAVMSGRLLHETSYSKRNKKYKELNLGVVKLDHYDPKAGIVYETKKSPKLEEVHLLQIKYYLWIVESNGMKAVKGILEYPKQRRTMDVFLEESDRTNFPIILKDIERIINEPCSKVIKKPFCKTCAYHDFCYINSNAS